MLRRTLLVTVVALAVLPAFAQATTISGTVTNGTSPLSEVCVTARDAALQEWTPAVAETTTGVLGTYALTVPADTYKVQFRHCPSPPGTPGQWVSEYWDDKSTYQEAGILDTATGDKVANAVLQRGFTISGRVTAPGDVPLDGVCVGAMTQQWFQRGGGRTGPTGDYTTEPLPPGQYKLQFGDCDGSPSHVGEYYDNATTFAAAQTLTISTVDLVGKNAELDPGHTISGTVRSGATPLQGICVNAFDAGGTPMDQPVGMAMTDSSGAYRTGALRDDGYKLQFFDCSPPNEYISEWWEDATTFAVAGTVTVAGADVSGKDGNLARGASIRGTVTGPEAQPLQGICVNAGSGMGSPGAGTQTQSDGTYAIGPLPPGSYTVSFSDCRPSPEFVSENYDNKIPMSEAPTPVVVGTADVPDVNAQLARGTRISGSVAGPGGPVAGICISVAPVGQPMGFGVAQTQPDGTYATQPLGWGTTSVDVQFVDCRSTPSLISEWYDDAPNRSGATHIDLTHGNVSGINATLAAGHTISGQVTDGTNPIPNIAVGAYGPTDPPWPALPPFVTFTDSTGHYRVGPMPAAVYSVGFKDFNPPETWFMQTLTGIDSATDPTGVDVVLEAGRTISGRVADASDNPLEGICVNAWEDDGTVPWDRPPAANAQTDSSGAYTIGPFRDGESYILQLQDCGDPQDWIAEWYDDAETFGGATPVAISGANVTGRDATLDRGYTISGTVTGEGAGGVGEICVSVWDAGVDDDPWDDPQRASGQSESDGSYTTGPLPSGEYVLYFNDCGNPGEWQSEWYDNAAMPSAATHVVVTNAHVTGRNIELAAGNTISGTVTAAGTGTPIENACVDVVAADDEQRYVGGGQTGADGSYTTEALPPGQYKVGFSDCNDPPAFVREWYDDAGSFEAAATVDVRTADASGVDAALTPGHVVTGTVTRSDGGTPIPQVCVTITDPDDPDVDLGWGETDAAGFYVAGAVPYGSYKVRFDDCTETGASYLSEWNDDSADFAGADPIDLATGNATVNAVLSRGGTITGTVRAGTGGGSPLEEICVAFEGMQGEAARTGPGGGYELRPLPTGTYELLLSDCRPDQSGGIYRPQRRDVTVTAPGVVTANFDMGAPDDAAPDTSITSGPSGPTSETFATFSFTADEPDVTFGCSLDGAAWATCTSPVTYTGLADGPHTLSVRGTDVVGHVEDAPATRTWTVDTSVAPPPVTTPPATLPPALTPPIIVPSRGDTAAPVLRMRVTKNAARIATVRRRGLAVSVTADEVATGTLKLVVTKALAKRLGGKTVLVSRIVVLRAGTARIVLKLRATTRRRLARIRKLAATLRLTATDTSGNSGQSALSITLKR